MMHPALPLTLGALAVSACVASSVRPVSGPVVMEGVSYRADQTATGAVLIAREGRAFSNWGGAEARRVADRFCRGRVKAGMHDRFVGDAWMFVGGCA